MTHLKLLLGICALVLGVMAISAGAAQAAFQWLVLDASGVALEGLLAELVGERDTEHLTLLTELVGLKISITCTGFGLKNAFLEPEGKLTLFKVHFTGCQAYLGGILGENLGCTVKTPGAVAGLIETNELKGEQVLHTLDSGAKEVLIKIESKSTDIASLRLEGCALTEVNPVRGVLYLRDCEGFATTHKVRHLVEEQKTLTALYLGAHSATKLERTKLDGSAWVKLGAGGNVNHVGLAWSGMDTP